MNTARVAAASLLLLGATGPAAAQGTAPSGVASAVMACRGAQSVYLLARERGFKRVDGWGPIGDRRDDDEPPLAAALSAFYESTNCAIDLDPARALQLAGPARVDRLAVYHYKVAFVPAERIAASRACKGDHDQWVWVDRVELLTALRSAEATPTLRSVDGEPKSVVLSAAGAGALRQAMAEKLIPEPDPCRP